MRKNYLDIDELAQELGLKVTSVRRKLSGRAWELPPRAHGFGELLRWRRGEVECWMMEVGWPTQNFPGGWSRRAWSYECQPH